MQLIADGSKLLLKPENIRGWAEGANEPASIEDIKVASAAELLGYMKRSMLSKEAGVVQACLDRSFKMKFAETGRELMLGGTVSDTYLSV